MDDEAAPSTTFDATSRDHTQTQRNLQQASAALEAAYHRIRQVRRSLLEVTSGIATTGLQTHPSASARVGPAHDAIVLVDTDVQPDLYNGSALLPDTALRQRGRSTDHSDLPLSNTPGLTTTAPVDAGNTHYWPSSRSYNIARRSQLENHIRRREIHSPTDDASTSLGRRVAAREAAGILHSGLPSTSVTLSSLTTFDGNSTHLLASIERDIDYFRSMARQRRADAQSTMTAHENLPSAVPVRPSSALPLPPLRSQVQAQSMAAGGIPSEQNNHSRRRRPPVYSRPSISSQSERLSLLSNFSVQNLTTPVSAGIPRPLIFDEPLSYISAANFTSQTQNQTQNPNSTIPDSWEDWVEEREAEQHRNYVVRRRLNADGEEHVHPINLEWIDDTHTQPWNRQLRDLDRRTRELAEAVQEGASSNARRRRGWARLDPDGNEIPSDEEEELERMRAEYRVAAQSRPRATNTAEAPSHSGFHNLQATTTSTSLTLDEGISLSQHVPRVRLNARDPRAFFGIRSNTPLLPEIRKADREEPLPPVTPVFCNPLPMPIEEMEWSPPKRKPQRTVILPKHASFAGR
ncbi:hypothetical protein H0H81_005145 [Sphagnurus paluster]|uniref:Uncharacterized protein n=1 Tax=Sphagnurus paluster TaxID=117069 RepID=A0A9P7KIV2_9AGAR|nr:hypothetical protein H0H81_005145 [Sphagnurus paluster]